MSIYLSIYISPYIYILTCTSHNNPITQYDTAGGQHHDHGHHPLGHKSSRHITRRPVSERAAADINSHHFTDTERRFVAQQQQIQGIGGQLETSAASQFWSPQEILATSGSVEAVRERNVTNSLLDFFGM